MSLAIPLQPPHDAQRDAGARHRTGMAPVTALFRTILLLAVLAVAYSCSVAAVAVAQEPLPSAATAAELTAEEMRQLQEAAAAASPAPAPLIPFGALPSANPAMSLIFDGALAGFSVDEPLQFGGHDPRNNGFNFQQLEMHLESAVDPYLHFLTNIVFGQEGVEVEEAFAESTALPLGLQLRAGQFLMPFGRINPTHPHSWNFVDQPLGNGKFFGSEGSRGMGALISWLVPVGWFSEVRAASSEATGDCCARSFAGDADWSVRSPTDLLYTMTWKNFVPFNEDWSLFLGLSAQLGPNATDNRSEIFGADVYLRYRPVADPERRSLSLQVEHARRSRQLTAATLVDQAGYAQLVAVVALRWETAWRTEWATGLVGDPLNPEWISQRTRHAAQLTFYPSHFSRLRLQVSRDNPTWLPDPIWGAVLAIEVLIGEHGAHLF